MSEFYTPKLCPAYWVTEAESWWLATELIRRHPASRVVESHAGPWGGSYNVLAVDVCERPADASNGNLNLNRTGTIQLPNSEPITWWQHLEADDPFETVAYIERCFGLMPPHETPVTTPRTLAYRVISAIISQTQHSKIKYEATSGHWLVMHPMSGMSLDTVNQFTEENQIVSRTLGLDELTNSVAAKKSDEDDLMTAFSRLWHLAPFRRAKGQTLFVHDSGLLFLPGKPPINLMEQYDKAGRNLERLMLSTVLPGLV